MAIRKADKPRISWREEKCLKCGANMVRVGEKASKIKSFSLAGILSFFLAACSCTIILVSSGLVVQELELHLLFFGCTSSKYPCCPRCQATEKNVIDASSELGIFADISHTITVTSFWVLCL